MKNVLFEQEKIKLLNKWHFVQSKTKLMQNILKCINFLEPQVYEIHFRGFFTCVYILWTQVL
jgi:hypothetical protein